jgi:hypothetical protein
MTPDERKDLEGLIKELREIPMFYLNGSRWVKTAETDAAAQKAIIALETVSARLEEAEALPCAIADWHCESDGCMANVPDKVAEAAKIYAANFHAWKERAEKAEQAAEEMRKDAERWQAGAHLSDEAVRAAMRRIA